MNVLGESGHLHGFTGGRISRKVGAVDRVDRRKVIHVLEENGGLYNMAVIELRCAEYIADILHHLMRFLFDGAGEQFAGGLLNGNLPRYEEQITSLDRLAVRSNGGRGGGTEDNIFCHDVRMLLLPNINNSTYTHASYPA